MWPWRLAIIDVDDKCLKRPYIRRARNQLSNYNESANFISNP